MKKILAAGLCLGLLLCLAACGGQAPEKDVPELTPVPADLFDTPAPEAAPAAEAPEAEDGGEDPAPEEPAYDEAAYQAARDCIGRTVEELFAAVGEPTGDVKYAASCLVEGGEDGMLFYDGFYVWTVRADGEEIVHDVSLTD